MTIINFLVRGECMEEQSMSSCFAGETVTLADLKDVFPFEGQFCFRQKVDPHSLDLPGIDYMWLDLTDDMQRLHPAEVVDVTAIAVAVPETADAPAEIQYAEYYAGIVADLTANGMAPQDRPLRKQIVEGRGADDRSAGPFGATQNMRNLSINNVTKAASSIWSSVVSTASTLHSQVVSQAGPLSDDSKKIFNFLNSELSTPFEDSHPAHVHRLQDLWDCVFPNEAFQRESIQWRLLGFQKPDPVADLKNSGILPLLNISYFCQQYASEAKAMIAAQKENKKSNYPFAIVCINITLLLADLLGLSDKRYLTEQTPYMQLFENELGFLELFAVCLFHLDYQWQAQNAVRGDFGKIMMELKKIISNVLKRGPKSVPSLHELASAEGMMQASF